ncbi:uncharacterized protein LOC133309323 [Gastrolobium bilobum]|uniref:uncharacterized protein LOC133309323 n=1 Tax=Gastrolobium bilobum TaxID=150636 RepID=UPI002AAF1D77|nr:uncharacterized protein LOC133309323 [Gastrolobium bilobum]
MVKVDDQTEDVDAAEAGAALQLSTQSLFGTLVEVFVDSRASKSFISKQMVRQLQLQVDDTIPFQVEVGDGHCVTCTEVCKSVEVELQGHFFFQNLFLFELGGTDVVLGLDCLRELGEIRANFKELTLIFQQKGEEVLIKGDISLSRKMASHKSLMKAFLDDGQGVFVKLVSSQTEDNQAIDDWEELDKLLLEFDDIFQVPTGLPPQRRQGHSIILKPSGQIPNLRLYRYPHYQKIEIEKIISDMLDSGMIGHSTSPYSNPIILVKKKDESWRENIDKATFRTHEGHYKYLMMPFWLTNALYTFQSLMNEVLRPYFREFTLVFFDDILVFSKDRDNHLTHLRKVFEALRQHSLRANKKKCFFGRRQVEYLGHVISS